MAWRVGTLERSMIIPCSPLADISEVEQIIPAAPISCIPITQPASIISKEASNNNFSWNGSPTWTAGNFSEDLAVISSEAKLAPPIPSFPVAEPTIKTPFPTP